MFSIKYLAHTAINQCFQMTKLNKVIALTIAAILLCSFTGTTYSQQNKTVKSTPQKDTPLNSPKLEKQIADLIADRVDITKKTPTFKTAIEAKEFKEMVSMESLMYPADELYGSHWENKNVNPFANKKIEYPDSCSIDCSSFYFPIDNEEVKITDVYGYRPRRRRMHRGIDLKVQTGDTIRAAFDGKIRIRSYERRGYGYYLVLRHPNGLETVYGHLSKFLTEENDIVRAGDPIGLGGNTGRSTGSHLHFEMRFLGLAINPSEVVDFVNRVPIQDAYMFKNLKVNGKKSNIYTANDGKLAYHRVRSGDTLGAIARRYGTSVSALCNLNGIKSTTTLRIGQSLRVGTVSKEQTVATTTTKEKKETTKATTTASTTTKTVEAPTASTVFHEIKSGDTLDAVSKRYGVSIEKLCELNNVTVKTKLQIGKKLRCS